MPPSPFVVSNGTMYIRDDSGEFIELTRVENIDIVDAEPIDAQKYMDLSFGVPCTFTLKLKEPLRKGQKDILLGKPWTSAANRYRRRMKRQKEKERRQKLKHESVCRDSR